MKIYRNGIAIHNLSIDEKTTIKRRLMVENSLNLSIAVSLESPLDLAIGDYTEVGSERYMIMDEPEYSLNKGVYDYTVLMRGNLHRLEVYMMPDEGRDEWSYSGSVVDHINMVVGVLNAKESGWSTSLPDLAQLADISPKSINYANMSILSALHTICSAENGWGLEFDVVGKKINFAKEIKNPTPRSFEYGKGKGLYELTRGKLSNERINTRVIGYGGKANQLKGLRLNFADINDGKNYIENNVDKYGLRETRVNFDHIFPRLKEAKIVSDATIVEAGKANWRVTTALDFDLTSFMSTEAVIMFQTGDCTGVEFQIVSYNHASKVLTFKENVDESGTEVYVMPNENRHPKTGDGFVLLNILMPDSYTNAAKEELKQATRDEVARQSIPQRSYSVKCDPRYFKSEGSIPMPGDACRVIDKPHGVDYTSRIIEINYPVIYPTKIDMVLADKIPVPGGVVLSKSINNTNTKVAALERSQLTEEHLSRIYHPFGGKLTEPLSASELRLATSAEVSGEDGYVAWVAEKLSGVGAEDPPASGGVGYWDELDGRPKYNALAPIPADANLDDRYSLANHNHNSAYAGSNHRHEWSGIDQKPTTISGYGITDAYTMTQSDGRYAALNGSLTQSFAVASLKVAEGENGYIEWSAQPLTGVGATDPPSGGGGTANYDELLNRPTIGGITVSGNKTLADYGLWNFGLATQSWIDSKGYVLGTDHRLTDARPASDVYAWAKAATPAALDVNKADRLTMYNLSTATAGYIFCDTTTNWGLSRLKIQLGADVYDSVSVGYIGDIPASNVYHTGNKPVYTASEVGAMPTVFNFGGNADDYYNIAGKASNMANLPYSYYSFLSFGYENYVTQLNGYGGDLQFRSGAEWGRGTWRTIWHNLNCNLPNVNWMMRDANIYGLINLHDLSFIGRENGYLFIKNNNFYLKITDGGGLIYGTGSGSTGYVYHSGNFDPASKLGINTAGSIHNSSDSNKNTTWFDYSWAGTGYAGSVINFSGLNGNYSTELFGCYGVSGNNFGLRTKNGDTNTWNPVKWIWHSGNLAHASTEITPNSLAQRDANGYLHARIYRDSWHIDDLSIGAIGYKISVEDGYHRFCTPNWFKSQLGLWHTGNLPNPYVLPITGHNINALSFFQSNTSFEGSPNSWSSYIILGHGDSSSYYNNILRFPFWSYDGAPQYQRKEGGLNKGWNTFWTTENAGQTYHDWACKNLDVNGTAKAHTFIGNIYNAYGQVVGTGELIFKQY